MIYNKTQIVSVNLLQEERDTDYVFIEDSKGFLGIGKTTGGIYYHPFPKAYRKPILMDRIPENRFKKGNLIYHKPRIIINYTNGETETLYFNTEHERNSYANHEFREPYWRRTRND